MIRNIPLNKLIQSPRNVRRTSDPEADLQLKADIEARGLLQNIVVAKTRKPRGCFTVEAGGRRLAALRALAEHGKLDATHEVACLVLGGGHAAAQEAGLAENFQRLAMNPSDECLAFQRLIADGANVEGVARRFGLTIRFVEGRLRLADLAPVIFEALGAGEITLDIAKAYAATPDRMRQAWVFEQLGRGYSGAHPDSIRRMMTQATASATDRRARFVGEEAYVAAGGRVERDLFSEDAATRWLDVPLLERLAFEKLGVAASEIAAEQGLAFVRPTLDSWIGHGLLAGLEPVPAEVEPLTDAESARIAELEAEIETFAATIEDDEAPEDMREAAEAEIADRNEAIRAIVDRAPTIAPEVRETAGTFLLLGEDGVPRLHTSYYLERVEDQDDREDDESHQTGPEGTRSRSASSSSGTSEPATPPRPALSQRLREELSMQRRDILAVHVAGDPALALGLAIFLMIDPVDGYASESSGSSLVARRPSDPVFGFETPGAPATVALAGIADALDRSWAGGDTRAERFDAFRALDHEARLAWLAFAIARTLEVSRGGEGGGCALHDHLGRLLDIDVASWWRPNGLNWFDRVPKALALEALAEVGGPAFAARYAKAKKAELSESCERIFAGEFVGEVEVKQAALAWVPTAMRFGDAGSREAEPPAPTPEPSAAAAPEPDAEAESDLDTPPWDEEPGDESGGIVQDERIEEAA
jgi:ParB family chromosome partitioning protein